MIPSPIKIRDLALSWIYHQFHRSTNLVKLVAIVADELQAVEDELGEIIRQRLVDNASESTLSQWGKIVGESRDGRVDSVYRRFVLARIARNTSQGTIERIITVTKALAGDGVSVKLVELYPAAIGVEIVGEIEDLGVQLRDVLQGIVAAGVKVAYVTDADENSFAFDVGPGFDEGEFARAI
jgi:hypothetical protein